MSRKQTVYLLSCVSRKSARRARARDLYQSPWFRKARAFVEKTTVPWFILSAKYGLLHPDRVISPYDQTLSLMTAAERRSWAGRVIRQMNKHLPRSDRIVVLAGVRYRQHLMAYLRQHAPKVSVPLAGMGIGRQLQWLASNAGRRSP